MNYTQAVGEKSTVKLTINFTAEEFESACGEAYKKERGRYSVPGFRKGKAPRPVIENYYGKGVFFEEAINILYRDHYFEILDKEKENFTAVGDPELSLDEADLTKGVTITAVVPVKPEVTIEAYKGLKIRKYEYKVTDEEVETEMKKLARADGKENEVENRAAQNGDKVNIDFSGSVDGEKFAGGTAEAYDLVLGSGSFIPGFEEQVVGMNKGEEKTISVKFPENYQSSELAGKDAQFEVKVNKITETIYPELTDEYVKKHAGVDTVEAYKAKTRERLEKSAENRSRDETENSIISEITKGAKAEVPNAMVESEIDGMVQNFSYRLMYQNLKLEEYLQYMGTTMEAFREQFRKSAEERVMQQLVIQKIVKDENITAEEAEVEEKIAEQAKSVEKTPEEYKKGMDARQLDYIRNDIVITKMFKFLEENNQLYLAEDEAPAAEKAAAKKGKKKAE